MSNDTDNATRPIYYNSLKPEPIEVIEAWELNFHLGNTIKYISRAGKKEGTTRLSDLLKARWYLDREITFERMREDQEHACESESTRV
jgi:hypothetical protein